MSKINLKTDYTDGQVLHGDELNVNNNVTMLGVNDNFDQIQKLSSNKADIVYVDNKMSSKVDLATLNTRLTEMDLKKADKAALATKADQSDLNKKANTVDVNNALATKADTSYVNSMLNTKASKSEVNDALATKANQVEIGNLEDLKTDDKSSVVNAINSINREAIGIATTEKVGVVKPDGQTITIDQDGSIHAVGGGSGGGTTDYSLLSNKPQINDVELVGNLSLSDLGLLSKSEVNKALMDKADKTDVYTKEEVNTIAVIPLSNKADKSYVDTQLSNKANSDDVYTKSAVDTLLESETSNTDAKLLYKANTSDVYTKSQANALLNEKANNLSYNNNLLQLTSNGTPIGDAVKIESSSSSDIVISHDKPTDNDWKLWIDSGEVDNIGSEVVNTLDGAEVNKAPSVYAVNKALETKMPNRYSTEEQVIGTWFDNKPIYRKVINCGNLPNSSRKVIPHYIKNVSLFTNVYIFGVNPDNVTTLTFPNDTVDAYCDSGQIKIVTSNDKTAYTAYAILEYTKTTD